jgi:hypothetical protein
VVLLKEGADISVATTQLPVQCVLLDLSMNLKGPEDEGGCFLPSSAEILRIHGVMSLLPHSSS